MKPAFQKNQSIFVRFAEPKIRPVNENVIFVAAYFRVNDFFTSEKFETVKTKNLIFKKHSVRSFNLFGKFINPDTSAFSEGFTTAEKSKNRRDGKDFVLPGNFRI